jgi:hypothetical protein
MERKSRLRMFANAYWGVFNKIDVNLNQSVLCIFGRRIIVFGMTSSLFDVNCQDCSHRLRCLKEGCLLPHLSHSEINILF